MRDWLLDVRDLVWLGTDLYRAMATLPRRKNLTAAVRFVAVMVVRRTFFGRDPTVLRRR